MEYVFRKRLGVELRYSLVGDRKVLRVEGRRFGDRWIDCYPLAEFSPICQVNRMNGREAFAKLLAFAAVTALFLGLTIYAWLSQFRSPEAGMGEFGFLMLAATAIFSLCTIHPFLQYRDARHTQVVFNNLFRQWTVSVVLPWREDPGQHPFIRDLRNAIAECFLLPRPLFNTPEAIAQLNSEFESLHEAGALSDEEFELLCRRLLGGVPLRRNIGFVVS